MFRGEQKNLRNQQTEKPNETKSKNRLIDLFDLGLGLQNTKIMVLVNRSKNKKILILYKNNKIQCIIYIYILLK